MGNQTSSQNDRNKEKLMNIIGSSDKIIEETSSGNSTYRGYKSEQASSEGPKDTETTETSSIVDTKEPKVKAYFEWIEGGNNVYITGSFANWSQLFALNKAGNNKFELCLVIINNLGITQRTISI
jgi:hypothetical protein